MGFVGRWTTVTLVFLGIIGLYSELLANGLMDSDRNYKADSLPAFQSDTASLDPFHNAESAGSPFAPKTKIQPGDTGTGRIDSITHLLQNRMPGISLYLGVDFVDFSAKDKFSTDLQNRAKKDSFNISQPFEPVHLAFPIGLQAILPLSHYLDLVVRTHSYWYRQEAILVTGKTKQHAGDEWFVSQGNLAGLGIRYSVPPSFLSVTSELGLYVQGIWYWNLGNTELYTSKGSATAKFDAAGSGYEMQFGFQKAIKKPWKLSSSIGYIHQQFSSNKKWSTLFSHQPPLGLVKWESSAIQANLNLWYYFGVEKPTEVPPSKAN